MNATAPWRTVLIEGQTLLRNALAKAIRLDDRFELLAELEDGVQGKELCLRLNPSLVVTGICLARMDGIDLVRVLIKHLPNTRVFFPRGGYGA